MPSPSPSPSRPPAPASPNDARRSSRTTAAFAALRTGVTAFAALAGLACYFFLAQFGVTGVLAVVVGLVFALLVRVAALSLLREWLLAVARRRTPPPVVPPTAPPASRR